MLISIINEENNSTKSFERKKNIFILTLIGIILGGLLYFRDVLNIGISKYIYLLIIAVGFISLNLKYMVGLLCFLIPLYNGLPSNYISGLFFAVFFIKTFKSNKIHFSNIQCCLFLIIIIFEIINVTTTTFTNLIYFIFEFGLIFMLLNLKKDYYNSKLNIVMFSLGTIVFCILALFIGLKYFEFDSFITGKTRFGDITEYYGVMRPQMVLTLDPNFIGLFCLVAISSILVIMKGSSLVMKVLLIAISFILTFFGFLTLSRTFMILYVILICIVLFNLLIQKNIKVKIMAIIFGVLLLYLLLIINQYVPELFETLEGRLNSENSGTLGGRTQIIEEYLVKFFEHPSNLIIGRGLVSQQYNLDIPKQIHTSSLQYLIGYGVVGSCILIIFCFNSIKKFIYNKNNKNYLFGFVPLIFYLVYTQLLPSAYPFEYVFPSILTLYALQSFNEKGYL